MDSISQAALGAAIGEAFLGRSIGYKGALIGAIVATLPDLDVLGYLYYSRLDMLSIHRGLSHSIAFSLIGGLLVSLYLKRRKWASEIAHGRLFLFAWLALFTHILLDVFTAYGTQIFLPFSDIRVGLESVNVVDPLYTVPLLIGLGISMFRRRDSRRYANAVGLIWSSLYLISTLFIKEVMNDKVIDDLRAQDIAHTEMMTMPVGIAGINWYGMAKDEEFIYLKAYSLFDTSNADFDSFPINDQALSRIPLDLADKMRWFAKGFYTVAEHGADTLHFFNLQVDMRGPIHDDDDFYPTAGYFLLTKQSESLWSLNSGTIEASSTFNDLSE